MRDSDRAKRVRQNAAKGIKPLVTFAICTYNQEKYVADAVKSAFSQTYSPLEILISDDNSKDRTWDIITSLVKTYKGKHNIRLNRNKDNLGVTRHMELISSLCNGDFQVICAGDDIALPTRVKVMVDRWAVDDYRPIVCYTNMYWMEEDGTKGELAITGKTPEPQTRKEFLRFPATSMPGASAGMSSDVNDIFGPLNPIHASSEDNARAIRGVLLDHLVYIDVPTLYWRKAGLWSGMVGREEYTKKLYYDGMVKAEAIARQALVDALQLKDDEAIRAMTRWWNECEYRKLVFESSLWKMPFLFLRAWSAGGRFGKLVRWSCHAVKYRWKFLIIDKLLHRNYVEMGDREVIYEERIKRDDNH